jgi:hypothetical protein
VFLFGVVVISLLSVASQLGRSADLRHDRDSAREDSEIASLKAVRQERQGTKDRDAAESLEKQQESASSKLVAFKKTKAWRSYQAALSTRDRAQARESELATSVADINSSIQRLSAEYRTDKPWYPRGFTEYSDAVAYQWVSGSCDYFFKCSNMEVVTQYGCDSSLYVEANVMSGDVVVGYTNDTTGALAPGQRARLTFTITEDEGQSVRLSEISCY